MILKRRKTFLIGLLLAGASLAGYSQESDTTITEAQPGEVLVLSVRDAVDYAIAYNKSLQNSRLEVDRTEKSLWSSIAQGLPQVDGTLDYMTYFNYEMEFSFGMGGDAPDYTNEQLATAWDQTSAQFPGVPAAGLTAPTQQDIYNYSAGATYSGILQSMAPPNTILLSDQSSAKLQVSQLIFSGQYIVGIQTARLAQKISEQNLESTEQNTKEMLINSYYLVLIAEESLDILKENVSNLEETLGQTQIMKSTGMSEQTDVDQIQITVNQVIDARNSLERNLELNYNLLRFQLGVDYTVDIQLTDSLENLYYSMDPASNLLQPFIIEENITYQMIQTQEDISKKLLDMEQWNYAPTIAGFYNYNAKIKTTEFDMNPNHLMGLNLSLPIFSSGMRKAKVDQARIEYNMAQTNTEIIIDQLNLQEKQLKYNLQSSMENLKTQHENVGVAQRISDSYRRKFEQGFASSLDLTQANSNYLDAQSNYLTAVMEVMNAKLALDKLMNKL